MTHNPGSNEAIEQGCTCPVLDNGRGRGYMGGVKDKDGNTMFIMNDSCPLHKSEPIGRAALAQGGGE